MIKFVQFGRNGMSPIWINPSCVTAVTEDEGGYAVIWLINQKTSTKVPLSAAEVVADLEEGSDT